MYVVSDREGSPAKRSGRGNSVAWWLFCAALGIWLFWHLSRSFPTANAWLVLGALVVYATAVGVSLRVWGRRGLEQARARRGLCAACGYDRRSISVSLPCPECGQPVRAEIPPTGRPVCARCGRDMQGREDGRTCPDCGAMYGIEYVEA